MLSIILAKKIASLLLLMASGFLVVRIKLVKPEDSTILAKLHLYLLTPCMIINSFQVERSGEIIESFLVSLALSFVVQFMFIALVMLIRRPLKLSIVEQTSIEYTNAGNIIIPLVSAILGNEWLIFSLAYICSTTVLHWTHMITMMKGEKKPRVRDILTNVNLICILLSFLLFMLNIRLPFVFRDACQSCTDMLGPVAMIITGMLLGGQNLKKIFLNKRAYFIAAMRLIVFPLFALMLYKLLRVDTWVNDGYNVMLISFLACCSSSATNIVAFSQIYGQDSEYASSINVITTIACVITIPLLIWIYQMV